MKRILLTYCLLLTVILAWSQSTVATGVPYECSFEESEDLSAWVLNYHAGTSTDKWMIGTAARSEGKRSLYISSDNANPVYGSNPNIVVSYLRYKFPSAGHYDLSFDWMGEGDTANSKLYVMVCPEQMLINNTQATNYYDINKILSPTSTSTGRLAGDVINVCEQLGTSRERFVCGSPRWLNVSASNELNIGSMVASMPCAIVFIWVNANREDSLRHSSIAIDNVQINSANIKKPTNVEGLPHCEDSTMIVTWESGLTDFDVEWRKIGAPTWQKAHGITIGEEGFSKNGTQCSYILTRIVEGTYDVRVRARLSTSQGDLITSYVYKPMILVYCPENHCVNYVDLHSPNVVCTYGSYPSGTVSPYDNIGILDFGPGAIESRHTLHVDPNELDPATANGLHTVPDGALASVRLGNWRDGSEAESITYEITVDSVYQGILLIKYAVVLEDPGHSGEPEFRMEVLDQNDQLIDASCGQAHFTYSDAVDAGWTIVNVPNPDPTEGGNVTVAWKDWTTVGVNLMPYHGQTIKVRFTTMDCDASGHFGYAYFTVDCVNAHIETNNCGNDASITCYAPEGFAYAWYNELGDTVSHERELIVDASRHTYTCRVSFVEEPSCYFEISTLSAPRFPVPEYSFNHVKEECKSVLSFKNTSHVMNKYDGYEHHTNEPCQDWYWRFRRLSDNDLRESTATNPKYTCPNAGDSIEVTMTCYIGAENACDSTRVDTIVVPSILSDTTRFYYSTCPENSIKFDDQWFNTDTVYVGRYINGAGCDSISILYLDAYPEIKDIHRHDSICDDQSLIINGVKYNTPLDDYLIMLKTVHDCDSAIYLTLTVNERIKQSLDTVPYACADEQNLYIPLMIDKGVFDSLSISFSTPELRDTVIYTNVNEVNIPYPADITPGSYTATFTYYQFCCGTHTFTRTIDVRYRSSIVEQKWNDVLTLLSPKYNGGFEFTAYQWYKDGMPLLGENHSYLYQPLDENSYYYVELTRADGVTITTCPIQPVHHEDQTPFPTLVTGGKRIPMYMAYPTTIWYYTMSGQLYSTFDMQQGYTSLIAPAQPGVYIIKSVNTQGETQAQTMIVE